MKNSSFLGLLQSTDIPMNNPLSLEYANNIWKVKMEMYKDGKEKFYSIVK